MATASRVNYIKPAYDTSDILLRLTSDEAIAVKTLVGALSGGGAFREAVGRVYAALDECGVREFALGFSNASVSVRSGLATELRPGFHKFPLL